ncbi:MAG: hypothetical protein NW206_20570 [Hyphomonadaceae bacterium]|nr:hypothetical protein [Hyphomonadaceae bacterium]
MTKQAAMLAAEPRLVTGPVAMRYLGGERPEKFGVYPIKGKRQRLYDRFAIDAALNRIAGLESAPKGNDSPESALAALAEEWR